LDSLPEMKAHKFGYNNGNIHNNKYGYKTLINGKI
jgi:hypothetical protein